MRSAINRASEQAREEKLQDERAVCIWKWWAELTEQTGKDEGEIVPVRVNRRGERAELKRCSSISAVALCDAYLRLRARLDAKKLWPREVPGTYAWLAALAGVLAHVDEDAQPKNVGALMGAPKGDKATVSRQRFQRLLASKDADEIYGQMRGIVRLIDHKVNVEAFSKDFLGLAGPKADEIRSEWAFCYFTSSPESDFESDGK